MATTRRRRLGIAFIVVGLIMLAFSQAASATNGGASSTTTTTSGPQQASVLLLAKDTGNNLLTVQITVDGQAYASGTTISVSPGQHTVQCGVVAHYIPAYTGYSTIQVNGPTTVVCVYKPEFLPQFKLTVTAKDANGNSLTGQIAVNGSVIGTSSVTATLNQGLYTVSCGAVPGYTTPNQFNVYLYYDISATCVYVSPTASQTTLTVLAQFYSTSTRQYYPLSGVNVQLSDGQSKVTGSDGKAVFAVSQNTQYTATVTNSGYGTQSKTVQVGTTSQATTIMFATSGFSIVPIGKLFGYDVTTDSVGAIGVLILVLGIILAL